MRLLWLSPYLPSPETFGGQRRIHGLMRALSARHDIAVLALHSPSDPLEDWLALTRAWCPDAEAVLQPILGLRGPAKRTAQLRTLPSRRSWELASHRNQALSQRLDERLTRERWDAVVVEFAQMAVNLEGLARRTAVVLDEHNVEFDLQRRTAASADGVARRVFGSVNWRKLRREEVDVWRHVDGVSATSERDAAIIRMHAPHVPCVLAPNGVDLDRFAPRTAPPDPNTVVLFGAHNYFPNTDGLRFLLGEIWPRVIERVPDARLRVIGHPPPPEVAALAPPSVTVEGFVDDVVSEAGRAAVAIAPLRIGGGTRLKVVEAMALARPVVATRIGAEGLDVADQRDLLLADDPTAFADAVVQLLSDPAMAADLGRRGRARAEQLYGWDACAAPLEQLVHSLVDGRRR